MPVETTEERALKQLDGAMRVVLTLLLYAEYDPNSHTGTELQRLRESYPEMFTPQYVAKLFKPL